MVPSVHISNDVGLIESVLVIDDVASMGEAGHECHCHENVVIVIKVHYKLLNIT